MVPGWVAVVLLLVAAGSFFVYWRNIAGILRIPEERDRHFGAPDAIFAGVLALFFLWMGVSSAGAERVVTLQVLIQSAVFYFCLISILAGFLVMRNVPVVEVFGLLPGNFGRKLLAAFGLFVASYPIILLAQFVSYALADTEDVQELVSFLANAPSWNDKLAVFFTAVIVAPVAEELIFRGYFYGVCKQYFGFVASILSTSLLFAAIHGHVPSFLGLFFLGVVMAVLREKYQTVWIPVIMHAIFNGVTVLVTIFYPDMVS